MNENAKIFKRLLERGAQKKIATELGISTAAVSLALDKLNPTHQAVQKAVKMIKGSDSVDTQRQLDGILSSLAPTPQPVQ